MILKNAAGAGILFLVGLAAQVGGFVNKPLAVTICVLAALWAIAVVPFRWYFRVPGTPLAIRSPLGLVDDRDDLFTPTLLTHLQYVISEDEKSPRIQVAYVTPNLVTLDAPDPHIDFQFRCFNGSPFGLLLDGTMDGRISCEGQELQRPPVFVDDVSRLRIPNGWPFNFSVRQWVSQDVATWIRSLANQGAPIRFRFRLAISFVRVRGNVSEQQSRGVLRIEETYEARPS
jgi:hypothetical protein